MSASYSRGSLRPPAPVCPRGRPPAATFVVHALTAARAPINCDLRGRQARWLLGLEPAGHRAQAGPVLLAPLTHILGTVAIATALIIFARAGMMPSAHRPYVPTMNPGKSSRNSSGHLKRVAVAG